MRNRIICSLVKFLAYFLVMMLPMLYIMLLLFSFFLTCHKSFIRQRPQYVSLYIQFNFVCLNFDFLNLMLFVFLWILPVFLNLMIRGFSLSCHYEFHHLVLILSKPEIANIDCVGICYINTLYRENQTRFPFYSPPLHTVRLIGQNILIIQ